MAARSTSAPPQRLSTIVKLAVITSYSIHYTKLYEIGGTYTPIAFNIFPDSLRWSVLSTVWIIVVIGMVFKLRSAKIHGFLNTFIYLVLGWGSAVPLILFTDLIQIITFQGLFLLLLGGLIFTIGFLIYYFKWPDPS